MHQFLKFIFGIKNSICFGQFLCPSSGVFHCTGWQDGTEFHPDTARKLSANLYDIYHCRVYSEKRLMMDRGTVRNTQSFL
jgi:hypothetical protein